MARKSLDISRESCRGEWWWHRHCSAVHCRCFDRHGRGCEQRSLLPTDRHSRADFKHGIGVWKRWRRNYGADWAGDGVRFRERGEHNHAHGGGVGKLHKREYHSECSRTDNNRGKRFRRRFRHGRLRHHRTAWLLPCKRNCCARCTGCDYGRRWWIDGEYRRGWRCGAWTSIDSRPQSIGSYFLRR